MGVQRALEQERAPDHDGGRGAARQSGEGARPDERLVEGDRSGHGAT
jgi:hypothetical protein